MYISFTIKSRSFVARDSQHRSFILEAIRYAASPILRFKRDFQYRREPLHQAAIHRIEIHEKFFTYRACIWKDQKAILPAKENRKGEKRIEKSSRITNRRLSKGKVIDERANVI